MDEIKAIYTQCDKLDDIPMPPAGWEASDVIRITTHAIEDKVAELIKDRDYWQALAMQFHDAVHAEIERRAKVEI